MGLLKKANELAILCGAQVVVLIKDESGKTSAFNSEGTNLAETLKQFQEIDEIKQPDEFMQAHTSDDEGSHGAANPAYVPNSNRASRVYQPMQ